MRQAALLGAVLAALVGCGENSELPKDQDAKLRNNLNRPLSADEVAEMGQSHNKGPDQGPGGGFHKSGAGGG
ncbi:hypothetical protein BH11ARM2_BH11ARM2_16660 [soil metagenome]